MGYTTRFTGAVNLSRPLSIAEAKTLLDIAEAGRDDAEKATGTREYLQWVPTETLDQIVWNGGEKFYGYEELMVWLCGWLLQHGVVANGSLRWSGESADDVGVITVVDNEVSASRAEKGKSLPGKPLTRRRLQEMALDLITQ